MTTFGKILVLLLGYALLLPAGFLLFSDNVYLIVIGLVYSVVMVFSGDARDRKFWRVWFLLHCRICAPWIKYD